ncbi:hypothetical protein JZ751_025808 [Albula glossodonta]|uniref:Uncharacterized protein n=1 Tax=Albula glossodonta TaxID=121402 RepID=A0A8T2NEJ4_9TELE|nr:hypothetical protein JZ751_025808 [Albula glossodonta]
MKHCVLLVSHDKSGPPFVTATTWKDSASELGSHVTTRVPESQDISASTFRGGQGAGQETSTENDRNKMICYMLWLEQNAPSLTCLHISVCSSNTAAGVVQGDDGHTVGLPALQSLQVAGGGAGVTGDLVPVGGLALNLVGEGTAASAPGHGGGSGCTFEGGLHIPGFTGSYGANRTMMGFTGGLVLRAALSTGAFVIRGADSEAVGHATQQVMELADGVTGVAVGCVASVALGDGSVGNGTIAVLPGQRHRARLTVKAGLHMVWSAGDCRKRQGSEVIQVSNAMS